jgi:hypothetical protein
MRKGQEAGDTQQFYTNYCGPLAFKERNKF